MSPVSQLSQFSTITRKIKLFNEKSEIILLKIDILKGEKINNINSKMIVEITSVGISNVINKAKKKSAVGN